jgi:hypothetical protein
VPASRDRIYLIPALEKARYDANRIDVSTNHRAGKSPCGTRIWVLFKHRNELCHHLTWVNLFSQLETSIAIAIGRNPRDGDSVRHAHLGKLTENQWTSGSLESSVASDLPQPLILIEGEPLHDNGSTV